MKPKLMPYYFILCLLLLHVNTFGQIAVPIHENHFHGTLHDNVSNQKRQGSGFNPLIQGYHPGANLFRDDSVGFNFEHIFNGAKEQHAISMFTPRQDPCLVRHIDKQSYEVHWPAEESKWNMEARMTYDLSTEGQVDLDFKCRPLVDTAYTQGYVAMMWASYMNRALDRKIRFWGKEGNQVGWTEFGISGKQGIEMGTVGHADAAPLRFEEGAQTLNLIPHADKKFILPFYYGLLDGDHELKTTNDKLLYLVLFDQTKSIRFAMWNFFQNEDGEPDTHSPAWDWQYVIMNPKAGQSYGYRARVVIKPFRGEAQVWDEYRKWMEASKSSLPSPPR